MAPMDSTPGKEWFFWSRWKKPDMHISFFGKKQVGRHPPLRADEKVTGFLSKSG
jgi:hypothetical protein